MADSRYGINKALTINSARSWDRMTCLPRMPVAKSNAHASVSGLVTSDATRSTSARTGTGFEKWSPTTASNRRVATANL